MTKRELVRKVQEKISDYPLRDIAYAVHVVFESLSGALKRNERVEIRGFGKFTVRSRKQIIGRNPKTADVISFPATKLPFFKVGKELYEMINR